MGTLVSFQFGKEGFFVLTRKSRGYAEAYTRTPHKKPRRLTPSEPAPDPIRGRKRTLSGWKLDYPGHNLYNANSMKRRPENSA
jgi:hypothetical protein